MTTTPAHQFVSSESQARGSETLTEAAPAAMTKARNHSASRNHLSFEAAEQAMRGVLSGEEGEHLVSCSRCQSLVQNMRPKAADAERFARWAVQRDIQSTTTSPFKTRLSAPSVKKSTASARITTPPKLFR
jgi:hypothetical protein